MLVLRSLTPGRMRATKPVVRSPPASRVLFDWCQDSNGTQNTVMAPAACTRWNSSSCGMTPMTV